MQLERPSHRWKYDIKIGVRGVRCEGVDGIHLAEDVV